jgi:hypothetical protein
LWGGEEVSAGARLADDDAPAASALAYGWQFGGMARYYPGGRCLQLGFGLHFANVDGEGLVAPVLRVGVGYGAEDFHSVFAQAGPSWDGERGGVDAEVGLDWGWIAFYVGYTTGDAKVVQVGVRVPLVEAAATVVVVGMTNGFAPPS